MKTVAHVQLLDAAGAVLHNLDVRDGISTDGLTGDTAARAAWLTVRLDTVPEPEFGSPAALAEYRQGVFREMALDQMRRGLDSTGAWDTNVIRCNAPSPEGGRCSLRLYHALSGIVTPNEVHERAADPRRPREIAEIWPAV